MIPESVELNSSDIAGLNDLWGSRLEFQESTKPTGYVFLAAHSADWDVELNFLFDVGALNALVEAAIEAREKLGA